MKICIVLNGEIKDYDYINKENTIKDVENEKLIVRDGGELYKNILNALNNCHLVSDYKNW